LGLLAGLAQREWLTIRRDRTNREYFDEFTRRWRRRPQGALEARVEIPEKLRGSLRVFDGVWYGSHTLTPAAVAAYAKVSGSCSTMSDHRPSEQRVLNWRGPLLAAAIFAVVFWCPAVDGASESIPKTSDDASSFSTGPLRHELAVRFL